MPVFGEYTTDRIAARQAGCVLYTLPDSSRCLLALDPPPESLPAVRLRANQSAFIARCDLQRSLAEVSPRWARVYDLQPLESGAAFCVMDRMDWPLHRFIRLNIKPSPADLHHLVTEILEALLDAQSHTGRSHGNLRAEYIWASQSPAAGSAVVLGLPRASVFDSAEAESQDLLQLGRLICELVASRRWTTAAPLDPSMPEFRSLGAIGRRWADFCRFLLNTDLPADQRNLELALKQAAALKPPKSRAPLIAGLAAALCLIIAAAAGYIHHQRTIAEMSRFNGAYPAYAAAYHDWFKDFTHDKKALAAIPALAPINAAVKKGIVLDPNNILHEFTGLLSPAQIQKDLAAHPHQSQQLGRAVVLLMRTQRILAGLHLQLTTIHNRWEHRGWSTAAAALSAQLLAPLEADTSMIPFLRLHSAAWAADTHLVKLHLAGSGMPASGWLTQTADALQADKLWPRLSQAVKPFIADNHPLIARFVPYAQQYLAAAPDAAAIALRERQLLSAAQRQTLALTRYGNSIRWDLVARLPPPGNQLPPNRYFPDLSGYRSLTGADNPYTRLKPLFTAQAAAIARNIAHARRLPKKPTVNYQAMLLKSENLFQGLSNHNLWIWKNHRMLTVKAQTALADLQSLNNAVTAFINSQINVRKWVAQLLGYQPPAGRYPINPGILRISAIPAVNSVYRSKVQQLLYAPGIPPQNLLRPDAANYQSLVTALRQRRWQIPDITHRIAAVRGALQLLIAKDFPAGPPASAMQNTPPWVTSVLNTAVLPARAAAVSRAFAGLHWTNLVPQLPSGPVRRWNTRNSAFIRLATTVRTLQSALRECRLFNQPINGRPGIADLYTQARANSWWTAPAVNTALAADKQNLRQLAAIQNAPLSTLAALYNSPQGTTAGSPVLVRAIWHRLGLLPAGSAAALIHLESSLPARLNSLLTADTQLTANRRRELLAALNLHYRLRWQARLNAAAGAAQITPVLTSAPAYSVSLPPAPALAELAGLTALKPAAQFNLLMWQFLRQAQGVKAAAAARDLAGRMENILTRTANRPGWTAITSGKRFVGLTGALQGIIKANPAQARQPSGPALAGWTRVKSADHSRIFTSPSGRHKLTFVLLSPPDGKRFYLCTTELDVGTFISVLNSSANLLHHPSNSFYNLVKPNENYLGPHTWVYNENVGQVAPATSWFTNTNQIYNAPRYSPALRAPNGKRLSSAAGGPPQTSDPVTYLPPQAAVYVAALLGCTLPTTAQWQYAWSQNRKSPDPHFPGRTLSAYVRYLRQVNSAQDARLPTPRYWDVYGYSAPALAGSVNQFGASQNPSLWFMPVTGAGHSPTFIHLAGNAAEWVFNAPSAFHKAFETWIKTPTALNSAAVDKLFAPAALKSVFVIGGSCLSPLGKIQPQTPVAINWSLRRTSRGFADVGVRLAYQPRVLTPQERLAALTRHNWYY